MNDLFFWIGVAVVALTHVAILGFPALKLDMGLHSYVNLAAVALIVGSRYY